MLKRVFNPRFSKEPIFQRDDFTDTDDFYHGHDKAINAVVENAHKSTQTDAADYAIDLDESEFNGNDMISTRERAISKKKQIIYSEEDYPVFRKMESIHIKGRANKRKMTFGLGKAQSDFDDKNFAGKHSLTILELCDNFGKKINNFYKELNTFSNQIDDKLLYKIMR